jgi:hypothetical protein
MCRLGLPRLRRTAVAVAACLVLLGGGGSIAVTASGPPQPRQFFRPLGAMAVIDSNSAVAVAHNAGDDAKTTKRAIQRGAGIVEIDVVTYNGRLYAAHNGPKSTLSRLAWRFTPPRTLDNAWSAARTAPAVQLDLKSPSRATVPLLLEFLDNHPGETRWLVSASDGATLETLAAAKPDVTLVLSIGDPLAISGLQADERLTRLLDGVSVKAPLLNEREVDWFHSRGLFVLAWIVDDSGQLIELLRLKVDAVATGNLAIIDYLASDPTGLLSLEPQDRGAVFSPWGAKRFGSAGNWRLWPGIPWNRAGITWADPGRRIAG